MPKEPRASSTTPSSRRAPSIGPTPRTASTTWTPEEDEILMRERAHGSNWGPIAAKHFPNKTPNACRKRHERLMERRRDEDWDDLKLENLATQYMEVRREMWGMLANRIGEKFAIVEQKCMEKGVKNLQHLARVAEKRQNDSLPAHINTAFNGALPPPPTGLPSSSSYPSSSSTRPRNSLDDSGIELSNTEMDTSDELSPATTRSTRGASGSSIPSNFSGSRRPSTMFPHPPPFGVQQQTPGQSPELVGRSKAGSVGSASAMWSALATQNPQMQSTPPQYDPMALHRGSLPSIHAMLSPRPGAPVFPRPQ